MQNFPQWDGQRTLKNRVYQPFSGFWLCSMRTPLPLSPLNHVSSKSGKIQMPVNGNILPILLNRLNFTSGFTSTKHHKKKGITSINKLNFAEARLQSKTHHKNTIRSSLHLPHILWLLWKTIKQENKTWGNTTDYWMLNYFNIALKGWEVPEVIWVMLFWIWPK